MGKDIVSAKLDIIFKRIFSVEENEDLLHDFLSSLLEIPYNRIQKIYVQNPEILPEKADGKFGSMDLRLLVDDRLINVEMQINPQTDFSDRTLYYWAKMYSGELKSGERYNQLKQSIVINILNFNMFDCTEYHSHFKILETSRHEVLSDKCSIHFFELKKINRKINKNNRMELWLQLINAESEEELAMLQNTNVEPIKKAVMVIHKMSADEKLREIARLREKALHDEASALGGARDEGMAEGMAKGMEKGKAEIIKKMRAAGLSDAEINRILNS